MLRRVSPSSNGCQILQRHSVVSKNGTPIITSWKSYLVLIKFHNPKINQRSSPWEWSITLPVNMFNESKPRKWPCIVYTGFINSADGRTRFIYFRFWFQIISPDSRQIITVARSGHVFETRSMFDVFKSNFFNSPLSNNWEKTELQQMRAYNNKKWSVSNEFKFATNGWRSCDRRYGFWNWVPFRQATA